MENTENIYLPKELFTEEFKDFSNETKLLFSMLLTDSATITNEISIADFTDVAKLINTLGKNRLIALKDTFSEEIKKSKSQS